MPTITEEIAKAARFLGSRLEAEILLASALGVTREYLFTHDAEFLSPPARRRFLAYCGRRAKGEPVAYILKRREFFGHDFFVDKRVLVPRPETELLVEEGMALAKSFFAPRILDIGTGSGCIAVSLAKSLPQAKIAACDNSTPALNVARKNIKKHGLGRRIKILKSDLLARFLNRKFDIIIANLPYIPRKQKKLAVEPDVCKFEPANALFGGTDGLRLIRRFLTQLTKMKYPPMYVLLEIGFGMKKAVAGVAKKILKSAYGNARFKKDLAGLNRICILELRGANAI